MAFLPDKSLFSLLQRAYRCPQLDDSCRTMAWDPEQDLVPRGFFGATGTPGEVILVLVLARAPDIGLGCGPAESPAGRVRATAGRYGLALERREDATFANLRTILDCCLPGQSLERQSRLAWLTACPLCRPATGTGPERGTVAACRKNFLLPQLALFPRATVVALGHTAHRALDGFVDHLTVGEPEPPGCTRPGVRESWIALGKRLNG